MMRSPFTGKKKAPFGADFVKTKASGWRFTGRRPYAPGGQLFHP